jgi:hypothetical protein
MGWTIDPYVNGFIPASIVPKLPFPLSYFLGYRKSRLVPRPDVIRNFIVLVSTFAGLTLPALCLKYSQVFVERGTPALVPSWVSTTGCEPKS